MKEGDKLLNQDQSSVDKELAFFGRITAGISHELNNVITIINEYSGLFSDLMYLMQQGQATEPKKFAKIVDDITKQVNRGKQVVKKLNRFAHSVDEPKKNVDIYQLISDIIELTNNFTKLPKDSFVIEKDGLSTVRCDPFRLQHAIFTCINLALKCSNSNNKIIFKCEKCYNGVQIIISYVKEKLNENVEIQFELVENLLKTMGGKAEYHPAQDEMSSFVLFIIND